MGVDLDGLAGDALAPLGADVAEGPHVVDAVGKLDHDDADVLDHGEEHLAEAFGLTFLGAEDIELGELGEAIDAAGDFVAELLADLLDGDAGVLDDVVKKSGLDGDKVHPHVGEDVGHHDGVDHVGLAGIAGLAFVTAGGEQVGLLNDAEVILGAILVDLRLQLAVELFDRVGSIGRRTG
jgi:hypothetical protein